MSRKSKLVGVFAAACLLGSLTPVCAGTTAESDFDTLKGMAGQWQGKTDDGEDAAATYEVSSGGTIGMLLSTFRDKPPILRKNSL